MSRLTRLTATSCLALMACSSTALADLAAQDVWSRWKTYMEDLGYTISALERVSDGRVDVTELIMTFEVPQDDLTVRGTIAEMSFVETGDGRVGISYSDSARINIFGTPEGEEINATLAYTHSGLTMTASGSLDALSYDLKAASMTFSMDGITIDGDELGPDAFAFRLGAFDVDSTSVSRTGDLVDLNQTGTLARLEWSLNVKDPAGTDGLQARGEARDVSVEGGGRLPQLETDNASALISAGLDIAAGYTFGSGSAEATFTSPDGSGTFNSTSDGGSLRFAMSDAGMGYETEQRNMVMNALMTELPIPLTLTAERAAFDLLLPTIKAEDASDFGALVSLERFSISDAVWSMFDPAGQLPRDPATLTIDLAGKIKLLFDYLDPAQAEVIEQTGAVPGEVEALSLQQLLLEVAGAKLTGTGAFSFDNSDMSTFGGFPRPEGVLDLRLDGGNGLLDRLVAMGLLPEDQAMGARMMMGLFARPGDGPDSVVSKIEVNEQGHVLANGQRIQ